MQCFLFVCFLNCGEQRGQDQQLPIDSCLHRIGWGGGTGTKHVVIIWQMYRCSELLHGGDELLEFSVFWLPRPALDGNCVHQLQKAKKLKWRKILAEHCSIDSSWNNVKVKNSLRIMLTYLSPIFSRPRFSFHIVSSDGFLLFFRLAQNK